jgi:hypothetical protein
MQTTLRDALYSRTRETHEKKPYLHSRTQNQTTLGQCLVLTQMVLLVFHNHSRSPVIQQQIAVTARSKV